MKTFLPSIFACLLMFASAEAQEWKSGIKWQEPPVVTPGETDNQPPSDAVVLFSGEDLSAFENGDKWKVEDGVAIPQQSGITSKQKFGDVQVHLEWSAPEKIEGQGQGRGNSGVYLMGRYEVQILDSYENKTYFDGQAGSIYKQTPPMVNAMRKPGEWNTYDIFFTAPRFNEAGNVERPAAVTLVHNGVLALNHFELQGATSYIAAAEYQAHPPTGPIHIQFHGNPVKFRNIWVRELKPAVGEQVEEPYNIVKGVKIRNGKPVVEEQADEGDDKAQPPAKDDSAAKKNDVPKDESGLEEKTLKADDKA